MSASSERVALKSAPPFLLDARIVHKLASRAYKNPTLETKTRKKISWPFYNVCLCTTLERVDLFSALKDVLSIKKKSEYMSTRSNDTDMLEQGKVNKFSNARFVNMTAKIWNGCPREIKEEPKFERAKILIKEYCRTLPI